LYERFFNNEPVVGIPMSNPIYYLYHHAAELGLRACLASHNIHPEVKKDHSLAELLMRCREANLLVVTNNDQLARNLSLRLLSENEGFNYRYPRNDNVVLDLKWVQKAVERLFDEINPHLEHWAKTHDVTGPSGPHLINRVTLDLDHIFTLQQPTPLKPGP
jgi:HEPN domain-containing protein